MLDLFDGRVDAVYDQFDESLQRSFPRDRLARLVQDRKKDHGALVNTIAAPESQPPDGAHTFSLEWSRGPQTRVLLAFGKNDRIAHLQIWDEDDPLSSYETKSILRPPFQGTWTAADLAAPPNGDERRQRFAFDWVVRDRAGKTHRDDGSRNRDYFAHGKWAVAPGSGIVVATVDGVSENLPGTRNGKNPLGNHIVLETGAHEYFFLLHLLPNSIAVRRGQRVRAGQRLGKIGNTGDTSEPSLRFLLADGPSLADSHTLPLKFTRVLVDGEQAERAEPVYGTRLAPVLRWDPNAPMRDDDD